ncbi:hypothetical protein HGRIS_000579 [Hohenbuehelia grisea]|uniref:C2H2-type domain-containing protein n=1 Tax=Hohenbuehelia grisea TaxID=104357 RepID=A0ABR3JTG9_9AGAR
MSAASDEPIPRPIAGFDIDASPLTCYMTPCSHAGSFRTRHDRSCHVRDTHLPKDENGDRHCPFPNCSTTKKLACDLMPHINSQ